MRYNVLAANYLLQNAGKDVALVHLQVNAVKLTEPDEIRANQNSKVFPFHLPLLAIPRVTLVLESDP